jgi:D-alanyl-lipoteichoic acid acyltransferase DltB (MBOAT superfamily)
MNNFNFPLISRSVTEYWRRWHISLSTWLSDYLFTPVVTGVRDWGKWAVIFGLFTTFFVSGLWHGAGWAFIVWGLLHGMAVSYEYLTKKTRKKVFNTLPAWLNKSLSVLFTFGFVTLALIFFRSSSVGNATTIIGNIVSFKPGGLFIGFAPGFVYSLCMILFLIAAELNKKMLNNKYSLLYHGNYWVRVAGYVSLVLIILMIGVFNGGQFIYFQF